MKALSLCVTVIGVLCDITGAFILAWFIKWPITKERAGKAVYEEDIYIDEHTAGNSPRAKAMMRDAKATRWGLGVLMLGFLLQAAGSTLNHFA